MARELGRRIVLIGLCFVLGATGAVRAQGETELKVALTADAGSLNPYTDSSVVGTQLQGHLFEPLVDYRGPEFTQTALVAERWDNRYPTTWRFALRRGLKFHDVKELTADDVKFSFDLALASPNVRAKVANVTEVKALDAHTVEIKTAGPAPSLLPNIAYVFIVPKGDYTARGPEAFGQKPIGSGPYRLERWDKGQRTVLSAFDGYWRGKKTPGRISVRPIPEGSTRLAELLTGGVDVIQDLPVENVQQVRDNKDLAVVQAKGIRAIIFPFNSRADGPLKDRRVRQAINMAIDRETIVRDVIQGFGEARTGPFGPGQSGYNAEAAKVLAYNPDKAKALLKEAGYANGLDVTWNMCRGCWLKDSEALEVIANQLRAVGVRVKLNLLEVNQLLANQNNATFQVGMIRWSRTYDADTTIAGLRAQSTIQKWYANDEVDKLIVRGRETLDRAAREKVYQALYKALVDDPPYIYLHAQDSVWAKRAASDWTFNVFVGNASQALFFK